MVQQINPMYLNFTQSHRRGAARCAAPSKAASSCARGGDARRVRLLLDDGSEYKHAGKLLFSDLSVDPSTGQITLRAEVPNPIGLLLPGMYVRVQLDQAQIADAITVPQQAVTRGPTGDSVMVVGGRRQGRAAPGQRRLGAGRRNGSSPTA